MKNKTIALFLFLSSLFNFAFAQEVRPIRDKIGFCWNENEMNLFMEWIEQNNSDANFNSANLIGGISVHDDYLYAGKVYYPLYKLIKAKEVVIFGVTHGTVRKELNNPNSVLIFDEYEKWQGPYGKVDISPLREKLKTNLDSDYILISNKAHEIEHSIEALIPWLQYYNRDISITPIMVTQMNFNRMENISNQLSKIILEYIAENNFVLGKDIFFLISNDANHYGNDFNNSPYGTNKEAHSIATSNDLRIIYENLNGDINAEKLKQLTTEIWPDTESKKPIPIWCGRYPVVFGLMTIEKIAKYFSGKLIEGSLFKYSDTFTEKVLPIKNTSMGLTAVFSYEHWCGWFTMGMYLK